MPGFVHLRGVIQSATCQRKPSCAQQECFDQNRFFRPEPTDNLTNLKAFESTALTPETRERCELTSMIETSVSRILGIVALALELKESDFVAVLPQEQRQKQLGRAARPAHPAALGAARMSLPLRQHPEDG